MDWTSIGAGVGAGLSELGHGRSYLDEEERKRRARQQEIEDNNASREAVAAENRASREASANDANQSRILGIADKQAQARGVQIHHDDVLKQIMDSTTLSPQEKEQYRFELEGVHPLVKPTAPAPRAPIPVDTIDKGGKHVHRFVSPDEAVGQEFPAYDAPKAAAASPLVRVTTVDPDNKDSTIEEFLTREEALARKQFVKPKKTDQLFNDEPQAKPAPSGGGLPNVLSSIYNSVKNSPLNYWGGKAKPDATPAQAPAAAAPAPVPAAAPAAAPSGDLAAKARAVLQQHGKDTSDAAVAAFLKNPANVKALGGG